MANGKCFGGPSGPFCRAPGPPARRASRKTGRRAQTTVELLLVLPIFCLMLFLCMELGNIAHQVILVNHCAYELARIGSLVAGPRGGEPDTVMANIGKARSKMEEKLRVDMFPSYYTKITLKADVETTRTDPQASGHQNEDLIVRLTYPIELLFPLSSYILSNSPNKNNHTMTINVSMRMPIEKPMFH